MFGTRRDQFGRVIIADEMMDDVAVRRVHAV